jgi:hypothetical protein
VASTEYHLRTDWTFNAPVEQAWPVVLDLEHYPAWWSDFRRVQRLKGDGRTVGSVFACEVRGALPYSLNYIVEVTCSEEYRSIELRSTGDLVGTGRWEFSAPRPDQTRATYFWNVRTTNPLLNLLAPLARSLFARNHEQVMNRGYLALRQHLER